MSSRSFTAKSIWWNVQSFVRYQLLSLYAEILTQKSQGFLWAPVFTAFGIAVYFLLPAEPPFLLGVVTFLIVMSAMALQNRESMFRGSTLMLLLVVTGFLAAQARTIHIHTPMLSRAHGPAEVTGTIIALESLGKEGGARITLGHLSVEDMSVADTPRKIRLRIRDNSGLYPGQRIQTLAHLHPPSGPVMPGAFDFRRYMFFQGIGAVGFTYSKPEILSDIHGLSFRSVIEKARAGLTNRVEQASDMPEAGIVSALLTGQRQGIAESDQEAMRNSGLAHILAISGLHIGLFSGVVFFILRLMFAALPGFAVRYPIKKYAAVAAFFAGFAYMFIAGASVSAQRALMMTGIVFLAIILDRSPMSLRLVAFAALVVLVVMPESLFSAGFQMSFAAVTALVVFYDRIRDWWASMHAQAGMPKRVALYFAGVCLTTFSASLATAPFALFHFQQVALFGLLANLLVIPLVGFVIMPLAVVVFVALPFGLEAWPIAWMADGVSAVLEVAHWVSALPNATYQVQMWPLWGLALIVAGALFMVLWQGRLRVLGLIPVFCAVMVVSNARLPDVLISQEFKLVGVAGPDHLMVSAKNKDKFVLENWGRAYGFKEGASSYFPKEGRGENGVVCGEYGCRFERAAQKVAVIYEPGVFAESCAWADVILSFSPLGRQKCDRQNVQVVDKFDTYGGGAHGLFLLEDAAEIKTAAEQSGKRPWSRK